ncbi:MAG: O-antigen ligase family protein [Candidatus Heteroscillospira sp.]
MKELQSSFFVALLTRFRDKLSDLFRGGLFWRMCMAIWNAAKDSAFYRFALGGEKAAELWRSSFLYRALNRLLNALPALSRALLGKPTVFSKGYLLPEIVDFSQRRLVPFAGLMMLALLVIPQGMWNNMYSLLGALALAAMFIFAAADGRRFSLDELGFFPVMFALCAILGFITSRQPGLSLRFLIFGITCMLVVLITVNAPRSGKELGGIVLLCSVGVAVCSAYALVQRIVGVEANGILTDLTLNADMPGRVYSFFENPNSFANVLVLFAPLMLTMALYAPKGRTRLWYLLVFGLSCLALLMTYSRGGWLSLAVGMAVLVLVLGPRWVPLCMVACVCAVPFLPDSILNRLLTIFNSGDSSIYTRAYIYSAMGRLISNHPLFGVGLGAAAVRHAVYAENVYEAKALFIHGHNIYLQIWGEMGVFALIAFLGTMAFAVRGGLQLRSEEDGIVRAVGVGVACGLCASLFFGITDYAWSYPRVMVLFWFVFALIPAARRVRNIQEAGK